MTIPYAIVTSDVEVTTGPSLADVTIDIETEMTILTRYRSIAVNANTYAGWKVTLANGVEMLIAGIAEAPSYGRHRMMTMGLGVLR